MMIYVLTPVAFLAKNPKIQKETRPALTETSSKWFFRCWSGCRGATCPTPRCDFKVPPKIRVGIGVWSFPPPCSSGMTPRSGVKGAIVTFGKGGKNMVSIAVHECENFSEYILLFHPWFWFCLPLAQLVRAWCLYVIKPLAFLNILAGQSVNCATPRSADRDRRGGKQGLFIFKKIKNPIMEYVVLLKSYLHERSKVRTKVRRW